MMEKALGTELKVVIETIKAFSPGYTPKILYIFVDKIINTRFFAQDGPHMINPAPGTVVDKCLVEETLPNLWDFYLVPHKATIATALPVHFRVAYNSTGLDKESVETYTYQ